ncbi:MAG: prohibitin family protein [Candidatus Delongbacteria bacterium]|nr:prohibitin family protein [Candidatus Delongbacteria bacterium]MBN2836512.1 prohibitin family protein [Candidatus Delongbacteria bacterium]
MGKKQIQIVLLVVIVLFALLFGTSIYKSIPAGQTGVATLFGEVIDKSYQEGLHFPVNPLYEWYIFDTRQQTHLEIAQVPTQDQLQTKLEVSIQFRLDANQVSTVLRETGNFEKVLQVHIVPKLRSLLREQGKSIKRAEDFFMEETQDKLQVSILDALKEFLAPKGVIVDAVLIRDIDLPPFITKAIESKKEREQEVEKQKAELERYKTEQEQLIAEARAKRIAAEEEAQEIKMLADAEAYKIEKITKAIANNSAYVKLQALESLKAISKDPNSKIYFINGDSPNPLPLMNIDK